MGDYTIQIEEELSEADLSIVERGLAEHGEARSEARNARGLTAFARDSAGRVIGGIRGQTVWRWLEVRWLWVAEPHRGVGLGTRLMVVAEREAVARGCLHAWLDTFDFQAPRFYARLGYAVFGTLEDFPPGHTRFFMRKTALARP